MAAVAVAGVASAQVTITGKYAFAYQSARVGTTSTTGGLTTDGDIVFAANEDLGGGMSIAASSALKLRGRGTGTTDGRDATLKLSGGFGTLMVGSIEAGNGILGLGGAGAPTIGLDDSAKTLDGAGNVDIMRYITPELAPGLTAYISRVEGVVGAGGSTSASNQIGANFSAGALTVAADIANYAAATAKDAINGACAVAAGDEVTALTSATAKCTDGTVIRAYTKAVTLAGSADQRTRISASYDLGMAKIGVGYQVKSFQATADDNKQTVFGVSVPMGALTLGAVAATQKAGTTDKSGSEFGLNYAMSKRTNLRIATQSYKSGSDAADRTSQIRLMHSF
jgi:hypothetical protein